MKTLLIILIVGLLYSCSSRKTFYVNNIRHAAEIALPADLDTVVIVDRRKIKKGGGQQVLSVLEGVVSGEPIMGDKYGTQACLDNMKHLVMQSDRLTLATQDIVKLEKKEASAETPIKGAVLDSICEKYEADGVISLELFDSDQFYTGSANVKTLWRFYYAGNREITDEFTLFTNGTSYYGYNSVVPQSYRAIANAGAFAAQLYYNRVVPYYAREMRSYYARGSEEFKMGKKAVRVNDWDNAIFLWQSFLDNSTNTKLNGRAAFNLALAYEMKMDFTNAVYWIDQSIKFGNRQAVTYRGTLIYRQNEQPLIEDQLKRE